MHVFPSLGTLIRRLPVRGMVTTLATCALSCGVATVAIAQSTPPTGDPQTNTFGWVPNSTNALNFASQTPGRVGQAAPHVLFSSNAVGSVTLDFFNPAGGLAFFEMRIDGVQTGATAHPVVIGDTIHSGGISVPDGTNVIGQVFNATQHVDIRLALGGERDWDFDWVRFEVLPPLPPEPPVPAVPVPTMSAFGLGLIILAMLFIASRRLRVSAPRR